MKRAAPRLTRHASVPPVAVTPGSPLSQSGRSRQALSLSSLASPTAAQRSVAPCAEPPSARAGSVRAAWRADLPPPPAERATTSVKLRPLARAVCALLALNRRVWLRSNRDLVEFRRALSSSEHDPNDEQHQQRMMDLYRTHGGSLRVRDLPLCPLTNFADERAREDVCQIVPGLYQTNWKGAEKWSRLEALGITHVVSTLEGEGNPFSQELTYLNLVFEDEENIDLSPFFDSACSFMQDALSLRVGDKQGKCLVHCAAGVSRSSAITLAFLVSHERFSLREAFHLLRERRPICWPNTGFMRHLIAFEASHHSGRTSLDIDEYEKWTEQNPEAVQLAKQYDRDQTCMHRVSREDSSQANMLTLFLHDIEERDV